MLGSQALRHVHVWEGLGVLGWKKLLQLHHGYDLWPVEVSDGPSSRADGHDEKPLSKLRDVAHILGAENLPGHKVSSLAQPGQDPPQQSPVVDGAQVRRVLHHKPREPLLDGEDGEHKKPRALVGPARHLPGG